MKSLEHDTQINLPHHIAIIMDGNGRWAKKRGLARYLGHEQGAKVALDIIQYAGELGIKYVTLYAFSNENWQRPQKEIDAVMDILEYYLTKDINQLVKNDIKIVAIGDTERLPNYLKKALENVINRTAKCKKLIITLALSYGAWEETITAIKNILISHTKNAIDIASIDKDLVKRYLYTRELPDPDLFIRTGGETRLSNFLLLQLSYSELYFCKTLWPDFQRQDFDLALKSYANRERRYGSVFET